jgi:hypothetical protein
MVVKMPSDVGLIAVKKPSFRTLSEIKTIKTVPSTSYKQKEAILYG